MVGTENETAQCIYSAIEYYNVFNKIDILINEIKTGRFTGTNDPRNIAAAWDELNDTLIDMLIKLGEMHICGLRGLPVNLIKQALLAVYRNDLSVFETHIKSLRYSIKGIRDS